MHKDAKIFPLTMVADIYRENVYEWTLNFMRTKKAMEMVCLINLKKRE